MQTSKYQASIDACAAHYGDEGKAVKAYLLEGERQAYQLDNRGAIQFTAEGELHPDIREAYAKYGFYVFTDVIGATEMSDILIDIEELRSTFPTEKGAQFDSQGRPALGTDRKSGGLLWSKPLSDPMGGTQIANALLATALPGGAPTHCVFTRRLSQQIGRTHPKTPASSGPIPWCVSPQCQTQKTGRT